MHGLFSLLECHMHGFISANQFHSIPTFFSSAFPSLSPPSPLVNYSNYFFFLPIFENEYMTKSYIVLYDYSALLPFICIEFIWICRKFLEKKKKEENNKMGKTGYDTSALKLVPGRFESGTPLKMLHLIPLVRNSIMVPLNEQHSSHCTFFLSLQFFSPSSSIFWNIFDNNVYIFFFI